ncbi:metallophosphatase [Acrocarpospora pleiomorpha]|uniref:Metallophosphatase n=1 Tax=Acrocarpospora pleiomorpha TaxID=90975 RepID=A0A5M3XR70_9ACTN|nr:alkaline phosphatase D family protein [Acrocarpospora pleiomorpha]GES23290.1 metallophosphatase [Acrocarpospora pleiomorpha]
MSSLRYHLGVAHLVIGPLLRHVDGFTATVWVETSASCTVTVVAGEERVSERTFTVHGHHYAVVDVPVREAVPYQVELDGVGVWPEEGMERSVVRPVRRLEKVVFGSCRTSVPHDAAHLVSHGVDTLRAYGHGMTVDDQLPDLLLMLGDQVYADEPSAEMVGYIRERRGNAAPVDEIADFEEYAELYRQAWTDPEIRWVLSTVPTAMIFDDHDLRDDWNTSQPWREQMAKLAWWRRRVVAGLGAYWVYQHLGNLTPAERAVDEVYGKIREAADGAEILDAFAERADADPTTSRWSYARDYGGIRLIMLDTRCARHLVPGERSVLDATEWAWLEQQVAGDYDMLLVGSSVPVLLPAGIHHVEAWNEALADGAWGKRVARWSERVRQAVDLEHWAAFRRSFERLCTLLAGTGKTVLLLSGDVHYSYVAKVKGAPLYQLVCSPIRNPLSRTLRLANIIAQFGVATLVGGLIARTARLPKPPFKWRITNGPWFSNALATLTFPTDGVPEARWYSPTTAADPPELTEISRVPLPGRPA